MFTAKTCGAKCKRTGQPCRAPAMPNGRCRLHGGRSRLGFASATFTHGRRSKCLLSRLAGMHERGELQPHFDALAADSRALRGMAGPDHPFADAGRRLTEE